MELRREHRCARSGDRGRERDVFGANLDAVLGVATFLDAAVAHEGGEAFALEGFAGGMRVEEAHL